MEEMKLVVVRKIESEYQTKSTSEGLLKYFEKLKFNSAIEKHDSLIGCCYETSKLCIENSLEGINVAFTKKQDIEVQDGL